MSIVLAVDKYLYKVVVLCNVISYLCSGASKRRSAGEIL